MIRRVLLHLLGFVAVAATCVAGDRLTIVLPAELTGFDWEEISRVTRETWKEIRAKLPLEAVEIRFNEYPHIIVPEVGVGGMCPKPGVIYLSLERGRQDWRRNLPRTLAHEAHHCARWQTARFSTLADALVAEGLADHFIVELLGGPPEPWSVAVAAADLPGWREKAAPLLHAPRYDHRAWFFGAAPKEMPRWLGYSLGFKLISDYLARHPAASASRLVAMPAAEILEGAGWQ